MNNTSRRYLFSLMVGALAGTLAACGGSEDAGGGGSGGGAGTTGMGTAGVTGMGTAGVTGMGTAGVTGMGTAGTSVGGTMAGTMGTAGVTAGTGSITGDEPKCFGETCECNDKAEGIYAMKVEIDVWWQDEKNGTNELADPGRGPITIYFHGQITDVDKATGVGKGLMRPCGSELPPFVASASCAAIQIEFPDSLWDSDKIPTFETTGSTTGFAAGDVLTVAQTMGMLGLSLNDGATFPTNDDTVTLACPEGTGKLWTNGQAPTIADAPCFPDQDGDGKPGITVNFKNDKSTMQGPGYGCDSLSPNDLSKIFTFHGAPLSLGSILPSPTTHAKSGWIGLRTELGGSGKINAGCNDGVGLATAGDGLPSRVLHCTHNGGTECAQADSAFLDKNTPNYHILKKGEAPPDTWKFGSPLNDPKSALLKRDPSKGPRSSVVRMGDLGSTVTCAQIRGASFLPFPE